MKMRFRLNLIITLVVIFSVPILTIRFVLGRSANLGRLVYTDFPKPNYLFSVDVSDLTTNERSSRKLDTYEDVGYLSTIDPEHIYETTCVGRNVVRSCTFYWSQISSPAEAHHLEAIRQYRQDDYEGMTWSPDGSHIAFSVIERTYVMNDDGTHIVDLTPTELVNGTFFTWSPDSQKIAFACSHSSFLCISRFDGSQLQRLSVSSDMLIEGLVWSPDGSQILYALVSPDLQRSEIDLINADGSNPHRLVDTGAAYHNHISWSPDSSKIVFNSLIRGGASIYIIQRDGSNLYNVSSRFTTSYMGIWSSDSRYVAFFASNGSLELWLYIVDPSRNIAYPVTNNLTLIASDVRPLSLYWLP